MSEIEELRCEIIANRVMVEKLQKRVTRLELAEASRQLEIKHKIERERRAEQSQEDALNSVYMGMLFDDCY